MRAHLTRHPIIRELLAGIGNQHVFIQHLYADLMGLNRLRRLIVIDVKGERPWRWNGVIAVRSALSLASPTKNGPCPWETGRYLWPIK